MYKCYFPINLDLNRKKCVVIGGGLVAERKVNSLLKFKAQVVVIAPQITLGLKKLLVKRRISLIPQKYSLKHLKNAALVIGATSERAVNRQISADAHQLGIPVNIVDNPKLCSFIVPASIKRGPLVVSISTSGQAPALAKALRQKLERSITSSHGKLALRIGRNRKLSGKS